MNIVHCSFFIVSLLLTYDSTRNVQRFVLGDYAGAVRAVSGAIRAGSGAHAQLEAAFRE